MIFHISIPARDPDGTAAALAELTGSTALPFHPVAGAWIVFYGDANGTAIEIYPDETGLEPGPQMLAATAIEAPTKVGFHAAIASPLSTGRIVALAQAEGWTARLCDRGPFELVEVWIDGRALLEVLTPEMQADYRSAMTPENWARWE